MICRLTTTGQLTPLAGGLGVQGIDRGPPPLMQADDGNLYGTSLVFGGNGNSSVIWRLVQPPVIADETLSNGRLTLTWASFTNGRYQVACQTTLADTNWTALGLTITATGAV